MHANIHKKAIKCEISLSFTSVFQFVDHKAKQILKKQIADEAFGISLPTITTVSDFFLVQRCAFELVTEKIAYHFETLYNHKILRGCTKNRSTNDSKHLKNARAKTKKKSKKKTFSRGNVFLLFFELFLPSLYFS